MRRSESPPPGYGAKTSREHTAPPMPVERLPGYVTRFTVQPKGRKKRGPYWRHIWRDESGRRHVQYVKPADVERVRAACAAGQRERQRSRETIRTAVAFLSLPRGEWRPATLARAQRLSDKLDQLSAEGLQHDPYHIPELRLP